jgi:hypothetical protein
MPAGAFSSPGPEPSVAKMQMKASFDSQRHKGFRKARNVPISTAFFFANIFF